MKERFNAKVRVDESGCHVWKGAKDHKGYGRFGVNGHNRKAHRIAWEMSNGPVPEGLMVCHHCDNPPCVNIEHLYLGNNTDNMRDMLDRNRRDYPKGEANYHSKLTTENVLFIRKSLLTPTELGIQFGVTKQAVTLIRKRKVWRHI